MSTLSAANVLAALNACEAEVIELSGDDWPALAPRYRDLRERLENGAGPAQMLAAAETVELFAPYEAARERLMAAISQQSEAGALLLGLAEMADQLGVDETIIEKIRAAAQPEQRSRFIWQSDPTHATSLKLENALLSFDFGTTTEFLVGLITTATKDVLGEANVILQAAGVLLMLTALYKATAIKLDERDATVFCGFARAARNGEAKEEVILAHTNRARHQVSLKPLDVEELRNALYKLQQIKAVQRVAGQADAWRIIEKHNRYSNV